MTRNPTARAATRRNVAERIDRFLKGDQRTQRLPNRRELFWLRQTLAALQEGQIPAGEDAMDKAKKGASDSRTRRQQYQHQRRRNRRATPGATLSDH
jgi:hypothetical protein